MRISDRVYTLPPAMHDGRIRIAPYCIWGKIKQKNTHHKNLLFVEFDDGNGYWYDKRDLSLKPTNEEINHRLQTMPKLRRKPPKFKTLTADLDEQCENLWGKGFTESWMRRKSLEFHGKTA